MNISELAEALAGQEIPGGCEDCDAYQTLRRDDVYPNITHLTVHHDDTCPTYLRMGRP